MRGEKATDEDKEREKRCRQIQRHRMPDRLQDSVSERERECERDASLLSRSHNTRHTERQGLADIRVDRYKDNE
eukprot:763598-Hanusia_phi.AAC.5